MKIKSLASLLVSTFLVPTIVNAGKLSDAYNGILPEDITQEDIKNKSAKLTKWQEETAEQFTAKAKEVGLVYEQVERFFAPLTRKGDDDTRKRANAVCEFFATKANKVEYMGELFNGHKGIDSQLPAALKMKDGIPSSGHHIRVVREVEKLSKEILEMEKKIAAHPGQVSIWKKEIQTKEEEVRKLKSTLESIQERKLVKTKTIEQINKSIPKEEEVIKKKQEELDPLKEKVETLKKQANDDLQPSQTEITNLHTRLSAIDNALESSIKVTEQHNDNTEEVQEDASENQSQTPLAVLEGTDSSALEKTQEIPNSLKDEQNEEQISSLKNEREEINTTLGDLNSEFERKKQKYNDQIKELERHFEALQKELSSLIQTLSMHTESKKTEISQFASLEKEEKETEDVISRLSEEILKIQETIDLQSDALNSLSKTHSEKQREKNKLQDEADAYALVKYLSYLNIYSALPNDDFTYHGDENWGLSTLSPQIIPLILELVNERADKVSAYSTREGVKREVQNYTESNREVMKKSIGSNDSPVSYEIRSYLAKNHVMSSDALTENIVKYFQHYLGADCLSKAYQKANPDQKKYTYWPQKMDLVEFDKESKEKLDRLRADRFIKKSMNKWRDKISVDENSLVDRLGFKCVLFNKDFPITTYPYGLSLKELHDALQLGPTTPHKKPLDKSIWELGAMQLQVNFFDSFIRETSLTHQRIAPIVQFVKRKTMGQPKNGEKLGFNTRVKAIQSKENEALMSKAFLKTVSYMNMFYALRHDEKGEKLPEFKSVSPILEQHLKDFLPLESRLDSVMASKALKWGRRVVEQGQGGFIDKYGLEAHTFTFVDFLKSSEKESKEECKEG